MITQDEKDVLNKYADLKIDIKNLEDQAKKLNPQVLDIMQMNEADEISLPDVGKLSLGSRQNWKFSKEVEDLEEKLKEMKEKEKRTGEAVSTETYYPIFKGLKED